MANRKDYSEIRKRRNYLPSFMVNWGRLPEYLSETNQEVQSLQITNTAVGKVTATSEGVETNLIVGKKYFTSGLTPGDDFTNVGWVADRVPFIATSPTPNVWTSSNVNLVTESIELFYNDIDSNIEAVFNTLDNVGEIHITNNLFDSVKTYPYIEQTQTVVVNNNTLKGNSGFLNYYFKIEVYV